jgi:hypothetical protein
MIPREKDRLVVTDNYLSVRQPYAWAIIEGIKDIENRNWSTKIRGRIYIHAGSNKTELGGGFDYLRQKRVKNIPEEDELIFGALIGCVEIVDCVESSQSRWHSPKMFGFVLRNPRTLARPIPMKANAKMQRISGGILRKIKRQG